jgi:hypothetical protein
VHRAKELPKEEFKRKERYLTERDIAACELLNFKVYKSQLAIIAQALETAGLMLDSDKARGYCLVMICADFPAGGRHSRKRDKKALAASISRLLGMLSPSEYRKICEQAEAAHG